MHKVISSLICNQKCLNFKIVSLFTLIVLFLTVFIVSVGSIFLTAFPVILYFLSPQNLFPETIKLFKSLKNQKTIYFIRHFNILSAIPIFFPLDLYFYLLYMQFGLWLLGIPKKCPLNL